MAYKVLFLTSAHTCFDDRIYYHQAITLSKQGFKVKITSLNSSQCEPIDAIEFECYEELHLSSSNKISRMIASAESFAPHVIICSEPIAIFAAKSYSGTHACSVVYDITEWYPSKKQIAHVSWLLKLPRIIKLACIHILAGFKSDAFIFGEQSKKFPLSTLFFYKKQMVLPYFPDSVYISYEPKIHNPREFTLCYTGRFSHEDGIGFFFEAVSRWVQMNSDISVNILLVGAPKKQSDIAYFNGLLARYTMLNVILHKPVPFTEFTKSIAHADICFDLREINFEYTRCLPIKYFYYIACGKPVLYSDLRALRPFAHNHACTHLVQPSDVAHICTILQQYLTQPQLLDTHSKIARETYEQYYTWQGIAPQFVSFIQSCI